MISIFNGSGAVFILLLAGLIFCTWATIKARRSGWKSNPLNQPEQSGKEPIPYRQIGWFWFSLILVAAIIGYFIIQYYEQ